MWGAVGLAGSTRGSGVKVDVQAKRLQLWSPSNNSIIYPAARFSGMVDVSQAGPAVNGRDQAGAFSSGFVYVYSIGGASVAPGMIASASPEDVGPSLPSGYTHWGLLMALPWSGSVLTDVVLTGSLVEYWARQNVLNLGSASVETAVSLASFVPPDALMVKMDSFCDTSAAGTGAINFFVRYVTGQNYKRIGRMAANGTDVSVANTDSFYVPNVAQNLFYLRDNATGTNRLTLDVMGFTVANGGEQ